MKYENLFIVYKSGFNVSEPTALNANVDVL